MQQTDTLYSSTHTLIHNVKGEELALSFRVTPGADVGLVGDSGSDSPPRGIHRVDICNTKSEITNLCQQNFITHYATSDFGGETLKTP